jgi:hypothetical protein
VQGRELGQEVFEFGQGVGDGAADGATVAGEEDLVPVGVHLEEWLSPQKAVAADAFAADDALEEKGGSLPAAAVEGGDGSEGIAEETAMDRDQSPPRSVRAKSLEVRRVHTKAGMGGRAVVESIISVGGYVANGAADAA